MRISMFESIVRGRVWPISSRMVLHTTSGRVRAPLYATGRLGPGNSGRTQDMLAPNPAFPAIIAISPEGIVGYMARLKLD
jgi:hypothetical protein